MANLTQTVLRAGGRKQNIYKLIDYLNSDTYTKFGRIWDVEVIREIENPELIDVPYLVDIQCQCAWNAGNNLFEPYYKNLEFDGLLKISKELNLLVEVFSVESGCAFTEHFYVNKGELIAEEIEHIESVWVSDEKEDIHDYKYALNTSDQILLEKTQIYKALKFLQQLGIIDKKTDLTSYNKIENHIGKTHILSDEKIYLGNEEWGVENFFWKVVYLHDPKFEAIKREERPQISC